MAFNKYANANLVKPAITFAGWDAVCAKATGFNSRNAAKVVLEKYDPKRYLLSHCTIIASVETEKVDQPLGRMVVDGFQIERKFADWQVTPNTLKYINNNNDCWEKKLLLSSFRTFTGGENYVEHIQIPELSKGKIIDSAARDIGDSIYVDILVATDRKHKPLIEAISSGQLSTLSMGCQVGFTLCTKCGNVAYDETQLCPHVKYFKGSDFYDSFGKKRKVAELCGHVDEEPGSVRFIEASWVANPAFTGAVLRNILSAEDIENINGKMQVAFSQPARVAQPGVGIQKAARSQGQLKVAIPPAVRKILAQDFGMDDPKEETPKADAGKSEKTPIQKAIEDLADAVREEAIKKVRSEISKSESGNAADLNENRENESIIKSALKTPEWNGIARGVIATVKNPKAAKKILLGLVLYKSGGWSSLVKTGSFSGRELLAVSRMMDMMKRSSMAGESRIYRAVLAVNGMGAYNDIASYLAACRQFVGRDLSPDEASALIDKGRLFALGS
jgi:hypothetical protein